MRLLDSIRRRKRRLVLDEVADCHSRVIADRSVQGHGLLGDLQDLPYLFLRHLHFGRERRDIGLNAELRQVGAVHAIELVDLLDHVHRNSNGSTLVGDAARDCLANPPGRVSRKLEATTVFEFLDGLEEPEVSFLDDVAELHASVHVLLGDGDDQAQIGRNHFLLGAARGTLPVAEALADSLQLSQRHDVARLNVQESCLMLMDGRQVPGHRLRVSLAARGLARWPADVGSCDCEMSEEVLRGHARAFNHQLSQTALV